MDPNVFEFALLKMCNKKGLDPKLFNAEISKYHGHILVLETGLSKMGFEVKLAAKESPKIYLSA